MYVSIFSFVYRYLLLPLHYYHHPLPPPTSRAKHVSSFASMYYFSPSFLLPLSGESCLRVQHAEKKEAPSFLPRLPLYHSRPTLLPAGSYGKERARKFASPEAFLPPYLSSPPCNNEQVIFPANLYVHSEEYWYFVNSTRKRGVSLILLECSGFARILRSRVAIRYQLTKCWTQPQCSPFGHTQ